MDLGESKIYLCLIALCCGPTQEDADFLRSLGTLLRVPHPEQASCITMLTAVSQSSNPFQMAEELALKLRENIDQATVLEIYCMLFLLCFHPPDASTTPKNRQVEKLYQHVQFNAKTSVIFRRLAFLLRIKLATVTKLEAMAIEHWKLIQLQHYVQDDESAISSTTSLSNSTASKRSRRKGVVRGLKIGATAVGTGALLAVTGGLAAPALAAGLAHIGLGAAATFTTTASVAAILGTSGAGLAGYKMNRRLKVVKTFEFHAINEQKKNENDPSERDNTGMTVYVCVSGYLRKPGPVIPKIKQEDTEENKVEDATATESKRDAWKEANEGNKGEDDAAASSKQRRGLFGRRRQGGGEDDNEEATDSGATEEDAANQQQRRGLFGRRNSQDNVNTTADKNNIASSAEKTDEDNHADDGKKRRGLFRRRGRNNNNNNTDASNRALSPNASGNNRQSKNIFRARTTAATSPEFYDPWGAQPPVMFPQHVLDRYYAVVAPEKRFLAPMLLQKYRKKHKREQRKLKKQQSGGASGDSDDGSADNLDDLLQNPMDASLPKSTSSEGDMNWTNNSDDELDADIDYGFTSDDQAFIDNINAATDQDKPQTADEKLFALLEREYGVHPLKIMEAAENARKEQQQMEVNTTEMYRSLLEKAQARMESLLADGHSAYEPKAAATLMGGQQQQQQQDLLNDPLQQQQTEMMSLMVPWNKPFTMEDKKRKDTEATLVASTLSDNDSSADGSDMLINLDENHADEEQVNKINDDLNALFGVVDDSAASGDSKDKDKDVDQSNEELLQEMEKLEIDTGNERKRQHDVIRRKLFEKKAKSLKAKADQAADIYWWRESVARTGEQYTLVWEPKILLECGRCVENLVAESAAKGVLSALQFSALAPLILTLTLPVVILSVVTILDNYWSVATAAADEAGELLADALLSGAHGNRPVVLVGYSVGGRVVASCLRSLARVADSRDDRVDDDDDDDLAMEPETGGVSSSPNKEQRGRPLRDFMTNSKARKLRAKTIVRDAVIIGAPLDCNTRRWTRRRSVVQGRLINVYNNKDWVLALLYRYKSWSVVKLAGLKPVQANPIDGLPSIENYNVSEFVASHNEYHAKVREILDHVGIGETNCENTHSHYFSTGVVEIVKEDPKSPKKA